jgi:hypothetical protein
MNADVAQMNAEKAMAGGLVDIRALPHQVRGDALSLLCVHLRAFVCVHLRFQSFCPASLPDA